MSPAADGCREEPRQSKLFVFSCYSG